jgi:hypothetical protein
MAPEPFLLNAGILETAYASSMIRYHLHVTVNPVVRRASPVQPRSGNAGCLILQVTSLNNRKYGRGFVYERVKRGWTQKQLT